MLNKQMKSAVQGTGIPVWLLPGSTTVHLEKIAHPHRASVFPSVKWKLKYYLPLMFIMRIEIIITVC